MIKKKRLILILALMFLLPSVILFAGCDNDTIKELKNETAGVTIKGGNFSKGSTLNVEKLNTKTAPAQEALSRVSSLDYNKSNEVAIFDIYVSKDSTKVQPNEKVLVTIPKPFDSANGFVVFHLVDENNIEILNTSLENEKISFYTSSFSVFIVAEDLESNQITIHYNNIQGYVKFSNNQTMSSNYSITLKGNNNIELTAVANDGYEFVGWYTGTENDPNAELITTNEKAYFTRLNTQVYARFNESKNFFLFKLEMDKVDETDSNIKTVEFYSTRQNDGKSEILAKKIDSSFENDSKEGIRTDIGGGAYINITSKTAYADCVFGTTDQEIGNHGFCFHDGSFRGKITINKNYKLFILTKDNDNDILTSVNTDNFQTLSEGRYFVVRTDAYNSAVASGKSNQSGELYRSLSNLAEPHDDGNGNIIFDDITACYEIWIQFDTSLKLS